MIPAISAAPTFPRGSQATRARVDRRGGVPTPEGSIPRDGSPGHVTTNQGRTAVPTHRRGSRASSARKGPRAGRSRARAGIVPEAGNRSRDTRIPATSEGRVHRMEDPGPSSGSPRRPGRRRPGAGRSSPEDVPSMVSRAGPSAPRRSSSPVGSPHTARTDVVPRDGSPSRTRVRKARDQRGAVAEPEGRERVLVDRRHSRIVPADPHREADCPVSGPPMQSPTLRKCPGPVRRGHPGHSPAGRAGLVNAFRRSSRLRGIAVR